MAIQNTFYLDVDIKRDNYVDEPKVTQNDAVTFVLRMTDDGVDYPLVGVSTYTLASLRPDGQSVLTVGTLTGVNEITFELGSTEVSVPGNVKAAIQLYDADGRVSSIPFTYEVTKDIAVDYVPSTDDKTLIQLVLGEGPAILAAAEQATVEALAAAEIAMNAEGPMGPVGPKGDTGAIGPVGLKGDTGAVGPKGDIGPVGPKGDKGNDGTGVTILGSFANESELPATGNLGDAYLISGSLYVWNGSAWENVGNIQGPQGIPGVPGETGPIGPKGDPGETPDVSIFATKEEVGDVTTLTTVAKKVVAAINEINAKPTGGDTTEIAKQINTLYDLTTGLIRYRAYDELLKQASSRLDGGTVFAHDMNGNIIGMTLDEANSQNIVIRDGKMLMLTKSAATKTVTDSVVVANPYSVGGNSGRHIIMLEDGTLIASVKGNDGADRILFYKYNGTSWVYLGRETVSASSTWAIQELPKNRFMLVFSSLPYVTTYVYNADLTKPFGFKELETAITEAGQVSISMNENKTEVHVSYACKIPSYPTSLNIRGVRGIISQVDGSVEFGVVEQWTKHNNATLNNNDPNMIIRSDGNPLLVFTQVYSGGHVIIATGLGLQTADTVNFLHPYKIIASVTQAQSSPSAICVPTSVNGLVDGLIATAWHGYDTTNPSTFYIRFSKSLNQGVTWTVMQKIIAGQNASITYDTSGNLYIEYDRSGSTYFIKSTNNGDSWGTETLKGIGVNPSTVVNRSLEFTTPLSIRKGTTSVLFSGTWLSIVDIPTLTAKAVYNIPSTDYVGAFVKKLGATTVQAYVNDVLADAELADSEYQFTKQLDVETPIKLRLELSRAGTSGGENDAVTRILGGRA